MHSAVALPYRRSPRDFIARAVGLGATVANAILNGLCRSVTWTEPAATFVKLHTGDPGAAGASNAATETDRIEATWSAASGGAITNDNDIEWVSVAASETYSHISVWDASSAGNFLFSDALATPRAVDAGGDFTIAAGDLDVNLTPIAA